MNNLRAPIALLVVIIVVAGGWFYFVHQRAAMPSSPIITQSTPSANYPDSQPALPALPLPDPTTVSTDIVGTWDSSDDPNYSVVIDQNGKWTDRYEEGNGSSTISETGTYTLFTSDKPDPDFTGQARSGIVYIKLVEGHDTYFYSVLGANGTALQLSYLARGNTLSFVKAQ